MGLLSNPVIAGLLSGGPNAVRAREQQRLAAMLPRGQGGMMGAPSGVVRQDSGLGAGLAGLGEGLSAIGEMRAQQQAQERAKTSLERVLGMSSGPDAIKQNVAAGGQAGPTVAAAASLQQTNPMGLTSDVMKAARLAYDAGDYGGGLQLVRQGLTAGGGKSVNIMNPTTGEVGTIQEGTQPPSGWVFADKASVVPKNDTLTPAQKDAIALGYAPGTPEFMEYMNKRTLREPSNTSVTVDLGQYGSKQQGTLGTLDANYYDKVMERGRGGYASATNIDQMLEIIDRGEITGGAGTLAVQDLLNSYGLRDLSKYIFGDGGVDLAKFNSVLSREVLTKQMAQAGPQTESDAKRLQQSVAGINNPVAANKVLLRSARAASSLDMLERDFVDDFYQRNDNLKGARSAYTKLTGNMPFYVYNPSQNAYIFWDQYVANEMASNPELSRFEAVELWKKWARAERAK